MSRKPEILAPAGGLPQLQAAVHAGADAVYFGLRHGLNARVRATGIAPAELAETMRHLHTHGCKGYLALNVLTFDEELAAAEEQIRHAARCGVDALIVQDLGVIRLARACAPHLPLHGSTQMSITDADGVRFARALGIERVVIGRELSIDEIAAIQAGIGTETSVEIEAFVHGALCVSYSGQCFSSEAWGGRSANRGQCAQACRLPYGLLVDGSLREQGDHNYLLSPQDLMALQQLPRLIEAGVGCFKIEGRLKGPEYVLSTVSAYREALDRAWQAHQAGRAPETSPIPRTTRQRLAQVFSRGQDAAHDGLTPGFLEGPRHQELVIGRNPRHRGLYLGQVERLTRRGVALQLHGPVKAGDGVVFDSGRPQQHEPGGNVFHLLRNGQPVRGEIDSGPVELTFAQPPDATGVQVGDRVWRTKDARMDSGPRLHRDSAVRRPVDIGVRLRAGEPLRLRISDRSGRTVEVLSAQTAQTARAKALDEATLSQAIGQLGDTPYTLASLTLDLAPDLFLPVGAIKQARREALAELQQRLLEHARDRDMPVEPALSRLLPAPDPVIPCETPRLSLLCRSAEQVEAALRIDGLEEIVLDFLEVHGLKAAAAAVRQAGRRLVLASPRIFKPGEQRLLRYFLQQAPDALLVRSSGLLWRLHQTGGSGADYEPGLRIPALYGDFSLNAANLLGAGHLLELGLERLSPTHDLNAEQIVALARGLPAAQRGRLEVIAHHHLPIFHTEHCVFARFLSQGNSYRDCGRPCETHRVHLRDPGGADHLLLADIGCRNTVFNAQAQSAAPFAQQFTNSGIAHYRIELVDEPADQVATLVEGYRRLLAGEHDHKSLWRQLRDIRDANQHAQGVGLGSLSVRVEPAHHRLKKPTAR